jgi:hypothetical protein
MKNTIDDEKKYDFKYQTKHLFFYIWIGMICLFESHLLDHTILPFDIGLGYASMIFYIITILITDHKNYYSSCLSLMVSVLPFAILAIVISEESFDLKLMHLLLNIGFLFFVILPLMFRKKIKNMMT